MVTTTTRDHHITFTFTTLLANSVDDELMVVFFIIIIFPRKQALTFHAKLIKPVFFEKYKIYILHEVVS